MKLDFFTSRKIDSIAKKADKCMNKGRFEDAIKYYYKILDCLPEPKEIWEAYDWAYTSIGDTYFLMDDYHNALINLKKVILSYDNPYLYLRYGQCQYKIGDKNEGVKYLGKAYDMAGDDLFKLEEDMYKELAIKNSKSQSKEKERENVFGLPKQYQYLEDQYLGFSYLWDPIDWNKIYENYIPLFESIPKEVYTNSIIYFISKSILESVIFLKKYDEIEKWLNIVVESSKKRKDSGSTEVWQAISYYYLGNESKSLEYFKVAEAKGSTRIIKNFYHFGNDAYKIYQKLKRKN